MIDKKSIIIDLALILITGGFWNLWMQYRQIRDTNTKYKTNYSFILWMILSIITLGIYHVYHEYQLTKYLYKQSNGQDNPIFIGLVAGLVTCTGLWMFVDLYQQDLLNNNK